MFILQSLLSIKIEKINNIVITAPTEALNKTSNAVATSTVILIYSLILYL